MKMQRALTGGNKHYQQQGASMLTLLVFIIALIAIVLAFIGTTKNEDAAVSNLQQQENGLYVLAGSELKDIEPFLADIKQATGVQIGLEYTGTLDGVDAIASGKTVDAAWFSHGKYLSLVDRSKIKAQTPTMLSPVVLGIKHSKAQNLGWLSADGQTAKADITWKDIAQQAKTGALSFAMTNPASSNSGFTALMGVTAALAGTSDAPTEADIAKASPQLKAFFTGQKLTSGSSGWLAETYVNQQNQLDGMINYESVLMQLNASGQLSEPLVLLYPKEGIVTADYPLMLINNDKRAAFDKVVDYIKSTEFQQKLMTQTDRRPVNTSVTLADKFNQQLLVELPFPNSNKIVDDILFSYLNKLRIPAHAVFVLDTSGSMEGEGINQLKQAMLGLAGDDTSRTGRFAKFSERERITVMPFSGKIQPEQSFTVTEHAADIAPLKSYINQLNADGGTAIFSSLEQAYRYVNEVIQQDVAAQTEHYYTVVLMTDGDNTEGMPLSDFEYYYHNLPATMQQVKTFPVLFGDANEQDMQRIANITGGRVFDGRKGELSLVFKQIRGYQ